MPERLLLPAGRHGDDADRARQVPWRVRVPGGVVQTRTLPVRVQVPGGVGGQDPVPGALLLPEHNGHEPDHLPDRVQVRRPGAVRAEEVPAGDVRVVRGEAVVRPVPQGPVLPDGDAVGAVSGGELLRERLVGADAVPGGVLLPAGVGEAEAVPGQPDFEGGVQVEVAVHGRRRVGR